MTKIYSKFKNSVSRTPKTDYIEELKNLEIAINSSSIVAITDVNGKITFANQKFCDISKYTEEELIGKDHKILKSDFHDSLFYEHMWDVISQGKIWQGNIKNKAKDGSFYWVKTTIIPFLTDGKISKYVSIRQDITSEIELSNKIASAEKFSVIGEFSSRLAHDLRNPLSIIQITLENLKMLYDLDEKKQKQFEKVERSINRMAHQIDDVLNFVKEKPLHLKKVHFSDIIHDVIDSFKIPIDVKLVLPKNDVEINCDLQQFTTVMNNLILNAIHAMNGKGLIAIGLRETTDDVIVEIEDSGKGIPEKDLFSIFEPLFTTKQHGTGLGLVSVKSIINAHGGIISVTSPPTIFKITLPKKPV